MVGNVVFADGFDGYSGTGAAANSLASKYSIPSAPSLIAGRFGGQAVRISNTNNRFYNNVPFASLSSFCIMMSVKPVPYAGTISFTLKSGGGGVGTDMISVAFQTDGSLVVYRGTSTIIAQSAPGVLTSGVWATLKIGVVIHDTAGTVQATVNGATVINASALDTRNGTPTGIDTIYFNALGSGVVGQTDYDDLIILDSAVIPSTDYQIESVPVASDGATLNWTPSTGTAHYATVDELPVSTTDYNSASTVGNVDELGMGALSVNPVSILAVQYCAHFDKTDAATRAVKLGVKSGSTTSAGTDTYLSSAGIRAERLFNTNPDTSTAWTKTTFEASKMRPEVSV